MSESSREPDAFKTNRAEAMRLKTAQTRFWCWANRAGGHLSTAFGESSQQPKQMSAGATGGTGQTNGCVASSDPDSDVPARDDYPQEGMQISPSQSDDAVDAEDEAHLHRLIPQGDDETGTCTGNCTRTHHSI